MGWNGDKFTISTMDEQLRKYYTTHQNNLGYQGTFDEFKQGKYGALYYAAAQEDIRGQIECSLILDKVKDFARVSNELIEDNGVNDNGIRREFLNELGYRVSLQHDSESFKLAVEYDQTPAANEKIAELLATKCFAFGFPMSGDIEQEYQGAPDVQAVTMKWTSHKTKDVWYKVAIVTVSDNTAAELTDEEVKALFLVNHSERVVWGNAIQPQRILNEHDMDFASSVVVSVSLTGDDGSYVESPIRLPFDSEAIPKITANDVTITRTPV